MKTDDSPEKIMARIIRFRCKGGKLISIFAEDQFSANKDAISRMGIERTLL